VLATLFAPRASEQHHRKRRKQQLGASGGAAAASEMEGVATATPGAGADEMTTAAAASASAVEAVADGKQFNYAVRLRGLPWNANEETVGEFLKAIKARNER
jgi:hypothetical protein